MARPLGSEDQHNQGIGYYVSFILFHKSSKIEKMRDALRTGADREFRTCPLAL